VRIVRLLAIALLERFKLFEFYRCKELLGFARSDVPAHVLSYSLGEDESLY